MRDLLARVRAALTPQALLLLAAFLLAGVWMCGGGSRQTSLERRASRVLSEVSGAGRVEVVISMRQREDTGGMRASGGNAADIALGAVAVAQGANDPIVCFELQQALCALLSLPASSVSIVEGGK